MYAVRKSNVSYLNINISRTFKGFRCHSWHPFCTFDGIASMRRKEAARRPLLSIAMHVGDDDDDVLAVWTSIIVLVHRYTQQHY